MIMSKICIRFLQLLSLKRGIDSKPKLRTHCLLKSSMETEGHLVANLDKHKRSLISMLQLGVLGLQVETKRYSNIKYEDRICQLCKQCVEDEIHFVLKCPVLHAARTKCLTKIPELFGIGDNIEKLKFLSTMPYRFGI